MSIRSALDNAFINTYRFFAKFFMPVPDMPKEFETFETTITKVESLGDNLRRVHLKAPEFAKYKSRGFDEYFALLMPPEGQPLFLPQGGTINVRAELKEIDEAQRPKLRWYSVRSIERQTTSIVVDIVTHGDSGPGSAWALRVKEGDKVGYRSVAAIYAYEKGQQLLVADSSSSPALHSILDNLEPTVLAKTHVVVTAPNSGYLEDELDHYKEILGSLRVIYCPTEQAVDKVKEHIQTLAPLELEYAWLCGESALATGIRRMLVKEWNMDRTKVTFSGYWKVGQERN